ncbi:MAG: alpha/beta hydrolase [Acidimicrobiaceae bacterium]|nr:alpha/beta hydrolase [Acidimicrobiaceae bacterium]
MTQPTATSRAREVGFVDGVRYLRRRTTGPSVIFVHGFCGSGDLFDVLFDSVALEDFDLIAVDLPGHGGSIALDGGEGQGADRFFRGEHLKGVANLPQGRPVVWVGWSLGAIPIAEFLTEDSQVDSRGVNLVGPSFAVGNQKAIERAGEAFSRSLRSMLSSDRSGRPETLLDFAEVICGRDLPLFKLALVGGASLTPLAVRRASLSRNVDVENFYRGLQLPLLVSIGERDPVMDVSPAMELVDPGSSTKSLSIYAGSGHSVFAEDCSRYSVELAEFVKSVTR